VDRAGVSGGDSSCNACVTAGGAGSVGAVTDTEQNAHRLEARRLIAAPAREIFAVLRDPDGHVAIDSSGMLQSADGDAVSAEGDRFVVHMDREALGDYDLGRYDVTVVITRFDPDVEIAWTIEGAIEPPIGHVYGYRLTPVEGPDGGPATDVLSYYDWSDAHPDWRDSGILPVLDAGALKATLGILERAVRRGYVRG
jgi:hypothetical protein